MLKMLKVAILIEKLAAQYTVGHYKSVLHSLHIISIVPDPDRTWFHAGLGALDSFVTRI